MQSSCCCCVLGSAGVCCLQVLRLSVFSGSMQGGWEAASPCCCCVLRSAGVCCLQVLRLSVFSGSMQGGWEAAPSAGGAENSALLHHHAPSSCHPAQLPALRPAVLLAGKTTVHIYSLPCPASSIAQPKADRCLSSKSHFSPCDCPSLPQPVKFPDWKCRDIPANRPFSGSISHLLSVLCVSVQILSHASTKKKREGLSGFVKQKG